MRVKGEKSVKGAKGVGTRLVVLGGAAIAVAAALALAARCGSPDGAAAVPRLLPHLWQTPAGLWLLAVILLAALEWRLLRALACARATAAGPRAIRGAAVFEFALLFPIAVMILAIIVQLSLMLTGNLAVNYAAYAAARAAVVQIPRDLALSGGEGPNELVYDPFSAKMRQIRRAAALAVTPVAGRVPPLFDGQSIQSGLARLYAQAGVMPRAGLGGAFAEKFTYADLRTRIVAVEEFDEQTLAWSGLSPNSPLPSYVFAPNRPVRVKIEHDLQLGVPFARTIFSGASFQDASGETHYYATVAAYYELTNEGPRTDPLPPYCPLPPPPPPDPPPLVHPYHPGGFTP
jgi:hypothetical protein